MKFITTLSKRKQAAFLCGFGLVEFALLFASMGPFQFPGQNDFITGLADCQIALATVLLMWSNLRWTLRVPLAMVLFVHGWAEHSIHLVSVFYPFVMGEEYLVSLAIALVLLAALWLHKRLSGLKVAPPGLRIGRDLTPLVQFTLSDLLLWFLAAGLILGIARRTMDLTDVSGMSDPWETLEFGIVQMPEMVLPRLLVLCLALMLYAGVWSFMARLGLTAKRWNWSTIPMLLLMFMSLTLGEVAIGRCMLLFEKPWPILPASMCWALIFNLQIPTEAAEHLLVILLTRVVVFSCYLLFLRGAGLHLISEGKSLIADRRD
jgi:hypothetical protein